MGMPNIDIQFTATAQTALRRSQAGVVAVILKDAAASGALGALTSAKQIPDTLTAANQAYLQRAFLGYVRAPARVLVYVLDGEAENLTEALAWLATQQIDYLAGPPEISGEECTAVAEWIAQQREDYHAVCKAVLPNTAADNEAVVNFSAGGIKVGAETCDAADYCSRIAGMLAGTPLTYSCTYAPLDEVEDVTRMTPDAMDTAVDAGKFLLFHDGRQVKTGRAVNSLTTLTGKSAAYQKIKIVEAMDLILSDLRQLCTDTYVGKFPNSYDNKLLLQTEIRNYLTGLERDGVLKEGSSVAIDLEAQRDWLQAHGTDPSGMTDDEILKADTGSEVFLAASVKILDAIEDIRLRISI